MTEETRILVHALTRVANLEFLPETHFPNQEIQAELLRPSAFITRLLFKSRLNVILRFYRRGRIDGLKKARRIAHSALTATGLEGNVCQYTGREIQDVRGNSG